MAFGKSLKAQPKSSNSGENVFTSPYIPTKTGRRIFRVLPTVANDDTLEDQTETRWLEVWWAVNVESPQNRRRLILDWMEPFNSPIWDFIAETTTQGSKERRALMPKHKFALNVLDRTPVITLDNGQVVYMNEHQKWVVSANNKFIPEVKVPPTPAPLNEVRILEGSAGQEGGKHLLQSLVTTAANIDNPNGDTFTPLYDVDLRLNTTGTEFDNTNRTIFMTMNFAPLTEAELALPRYDLVSWAKPWPREALRAILAGEPFDDIVTQYDLQLYPQLLDIEPTVEKSTKTAKAKKATRNVFEETLPF